MLVVPLQAVPSQIVGVSLANQACTFNVYAKSAGLYIDVLVNNALIIGGVICQDLNRIVRDVYLGFIGDLIFFDTQGASDPTYSGLGGRFVLLYLDPSEVAI